MVHTSSCVSTPAESSSCVSVIVVLVNAIGREDRGDRQATDSFFARILLLELKRS
jgi:hypothetical protein